MKTPLDSVSIEFPCPHCTNKNSQTIGQLKSVQQMTCRHCGQAFDLDATKLRREIAQVDQQLAQIQRSLRRLGK